MRPSDHPRAGVVIAPRRPNHSIRIGLTIVAALAGLTVCAEDPERDLTELSLDELLEIRVKTVTAATKRPQSVSDAPSSVSVVSSDDIRKLGYQHLGDILAATTGFYTSNDRNYTYLGVRGFSRPGDYNSRVLLLVNGQRANDNVTGGALIGSESFIDPDLIDRVEIIRGPGSALYGSNAIFAVVNVVTRSGRDLNGAEASFTAGSYDSYQGRFSYGQSFKSGVDLLLSGTVLDRGGHSSLYYAEYDDPSTGNGITRNTDGETRQTFFGRLEWQGLSLEGGWGQRTKQIPTGAFETVYGDPRTQTIDGEYYTRLRLQHEFENGIQLDASVSSSYYYFDGTYITENEDPNALPKTYGFIDQIRGRWLTEEIQLSKEWWERLTITAGLEARQNLNQDQDNYRDDTEEIILDAPRTSQTWGPYFDSSVMVLTNLTLSAGVRYDQGDFVGSAVSPRASLIYRPVKPTTLKLLYGRAFRGPNAYERFYSDGGLTQMGNPNLKPETVDTYEAVAEQEFGEHFHASIAAYQYDVQDLIDQQTVGGLLVYQNLERARGRGLEFGVSAHFAHGLRGRLSYAVQETIDLDTRLRLSNSPERLVQGSLIVPVYAEKIFTGVDFRYVSGRTSAAGADIPPYFALNLTLFTHRWVNGLELSASIYNLLDRRILEPAPLELRQKAVEQDGRTFQVKLTYHF